MVILLVLTLLVVVGALAVTLSRRPVASSDGAEIALVAARLEGVPQALMATREQLATLSERVATVEASAGAVREGLQRLDTSLIQTGAVTTGIRDATETIRQQIARAQEGLGQLQATARSRQEVEDLTARSIRRLETVIAGTSTKGAAGENMCEIIFAQLPHEWQERDYRIGHRTVEFALRLPNNLVVPIDSKWPATSAIEQLLGTEDPAEQRRLKREIQQAVVAKAKEVRKYVDPGLTSDFGLAVVPDAVYELSGGVLGEVASMGVMLVSQSMFLPCLMLLVQSAVRDSRDIDIERLGGYLKSADDGLIALSKEIEGRLSGAIVQLGNSRDALRAQTARVHAGLSAVSIPGEPAPAPPLLTALEEMP